MTIYHIHILRISNTMPDRHIENRINNRQRVVKYIQYSYFLFGFVVVKLFCSTTWNTTITNDNRNKECFWMLEYLDPKQNKTNSYTNRACIGEKMEPTEWRIWFARVSYGCRCKCTGWLIVFNWLKCGISRATNTFIIMASFH